jgi:hypothetical protein
LNHNLPGAGFKFQTGGSIGRDQYLRLPNETDAFRNVLPGSDLPLPFKDIAVNGAVSVTGISAAIDLGIAVAEGQVGSVNGSVTVTGDELSVDVGAGIARGAASYAASGHEIEADYGVVSVASGANIATTGHELGADVGSAGLSGAAEVTASGHEISVDAGTPTIGGAGVAAPGGVVSQSYVGTSDAAAAGSVAVSGDELTADVGTVVVTTPYLLEVYDAAVSITADVIALATTNGDALPLGVESQAGVGIAIAAGVGAAVTLHRVHRRPVVWEWPVAKEKSPEGSSVAEAFPGGVSATANVGLVRVNGSARVIPMSAFGRSRIGVVAAEVDYTLRDQQEEEFMQILLAA